MTSEQIDALLAEAEKITPEQQKYIELANEGKNIGAILTPSKWFDVGMKTALGNVRRALTAGDRTNV